MITENNLKHIFITGASGFIGNHLLKELNGLNAKLYLLIRENESIPKFPYSNIEWIKGDLNKPETYLEFIKKSDIVIHMAAELYNIKYFWKTNVEAVELLINEINVSSVKKVIHLSSVGVVGMQYSSKNTVVTEDTACFPKNDYEKTKLISENLLKEKLIDRELVIIRPTNVFGEEHPRKHLKNIIEHIATRNYFLCSKHSMVNYIYAGDIASSIAFFIKNPQINGIFNIGESISLFKFIDIIRKHTLSRCKILFIPDLFFHLIKILKYLFPSEIFNKILSLNNKVIYSDKKIMKEFNYTYGIEFGLKKTCDYYLETYKNA
ncbi:MAG: NAD-dependent epimerase/dehydratase family protein [Bacteroidales bacterium]